MRPRHPHAAESGVGKYIARESESAQACTAKTDKTINADKIVAGDFSQDAEVYQLAA
jgi:hypothetical protein